MEFTHLNEAGRGRMVDVSDKSDTKRTATARGKIYLNGETLEKVKMGTMTKGDVLAVAQIAGILAAKKQRIIFRCAITSCCKVSI